MTIHLDTERRVVTIDDVEMSFASLSYYAELHQLAQEMVTLQQALRSSGEFLAMRQMH